MVRHSLLTEDVFRVTATDGTVTRLSLPHVLARLSAGDDLLFTALRPHQGPGWHAWLAQLAFLALETEPDDEPAIPTDATVWTDRLRALTPGHDDDAPWCLLNDDWQRPALLQPPCSAARVADFKRSADAAQDIDVLVTARHHDEKGGKLPLDGDDLDTLVYALVMLQGWSPFLGAGNYPTMRMNGGFSSRPQFRLAFARGSGAEFRRDLAVLLAARDELQQQVARRDAGAPGGEPHLLLWLLPWDGGSLPLHAVHPLCLEVCRRVRLVRQNGRLRLLRAGSDGPRVDAKHLRGDVLDPWVPIVRGAEPKALTAQAHTLGYRSLQSILFDRERHTLPLLAQPSVAERRAGRAGTLIAQVLVSGDGGTDGLLRRELPVPASALADLADGSATLARRAQAFVEWAGVASGKVYRSALLQFVDGSEEVDWKNRDFGRAVEPWIDRFEHTIDEAFFVELFETVRMGRDDADAQRQWVRWLEQAMQAQLPAALDALPTRHPTRLFARARADNVLRWATRKHLGEWLATATSTASTETSDG